MQKGKLSVCITYVDIYLQPILQVMYSVHKAATTADVAHVNKTELVDFDNDYL